ncbi:dockerin [Massilia luteola]|uniref:dockerin n=1 Tax=Massilia luteola TaxID=3081751 RepID=UPI002ACC0356|nr:dockerin [Massilia sp. Gc5]
MIRKHNYIIPALLGALLAGCSGGSAPPGASGTAPVLAATTGSVTTYTSVKWAGGGYVTGLVYHPTTAGLMYARTDVGGAYRWNDSNGSWTPITDGLGFNGGESEFHGVESIGLDPANDQLVYLVTGVYTKDGSGNPTNGRIYASSNRGLTWTHYDLPFPVGGNEGGRAIGERLKLDPTNPSTMFYASRTAGLWKSTNSGQTWTQTALSSIVLTGAQIQAIGAVKGVEQIMFDNSNVGGGQTTWIMYAAVAPDYGQVAGLTSTLYKSVNGGFSWTPVSVPSNVSGYYVPHMVRTSDGMYYVVFNQNAGEGAGGPGYLYKFGGVAGNESWTQLSSITTGGGYGGVSVYGTGSTARIALAVTGTWSSAGPVVQLSDNGGGTWREIAGGMLHYGGQFWGWVDDIEIDPANRDHIMHVTGGGVWETWNASSATPSWDFPNNNLEETATLAVVTPPAGAPYKFVNSAGDIGTWVQTDLATTPTRGPLADWNNGNYADVLWSDPNYIVGAGFNNASQPKSVFGFWSGDAGNSWSNFATLPAGAAANDSDNGSIVTTSRNNVIWAPSATVPSYTTNNGASWTATNLPAPANPGGWPNGYRLVVDRKNPNKVYAYDSGGAFWGPAGKVYVSTDGGHNFTLSQGSVSANLYHNAFDLTSMVVNPNVEGDLWLADGNAVYHSTNSGSTWTKLNGFATVGDDGARGQLHGASVIALGKAQAGSPYPAAIYVVGTMNGVWGLYHSDDGGATWARFNDDAHQYGGIGAMAGDWNTYGRVYFSGAGRGLIYTN